MGEGTHQRGDHGAIWRSRLPEARRSVACEEREEALVRFQELTQWGRDFGLLGRGAGRGARGRGKRSFNQKKIEMRGREVLTKKIEETQFNLI